MPCLLNLSPLTHTLYHLYQVRNPFWYSVTSQVSAICAIRLKGRCTQTTTGTLPIQTIYFVALKAMVQMVQVVLFNQIRRLICTSAGAAPGTNGTILVGQSRLVGMHCAPPGRDGPIAERSRAYTVTPGIPGTLRHVFLSTSLCPAPLYLCHVIRDYL